MNVRRSVFALTALVALSASIALTGSARSASADGGGIATRSYVQTNLVSDIPGLAAHTDPNLKNPWGTSVGPGSPIWVSDNHAGVTTLYDGAGNAQSLVVAIPAPPSAGAGAVGAPTGQAFNTFDPSSQDFVISQDGKSGPAFFLFATEDGTIAGWNPTVDHAHAVIPVDRRSSGSDLSTRSRKPSRLSSRRAPVAPRKPTLPILSASSAFSAVVRSLRCRSARTPMRSCRP